MLKEDMTFRMPAKFNSRIEQMAQTDFCGIVIAGAAIAGAAISYKGMKNAEKASNAQVKSAEQAADSSWQQYVQSREDNLPWLNAGNMALGRISGMTPEQLANDGGTPEAGQGGLIDGPSMQDFEQSPYYRYALDEQLRATDRANAGRGLYGSGKANLDLQSRANLNATGNYGSFVNDWISTKLNPAQSLAGLGQTTGLNLGQQGVQTGAYQGSAYMNAGNARASGYQAQSNIMNKGIQGFSDLVTNPTVQKGLGSLGNTISGWFGGGSQVPSNPYAGYGTDSSWYTQPGADMYTGGQYGL